MSVWEFLKEAALVPGVTGNEEGIARFMRDRFSAFCDEVTVDRMNNVIARQAGPGPRVLVCAHQDEIGMTVTKIEEDGSVRVKNVGGVDTRVLPGMRVRVLGREELTGVIGCGQTDRKCDPEVNPTFESLYIDLGMSPERVRDTVSIGDTVCFEYHPTELKNGFAAVKSCDDRACVGIMLRAAELLRTMSHEADIWYVCSTQEEIGSYGASAGCFGIEPDYAVAFDVCHAVTPGAPENRVHAPDSLVLTRGPVIHPFLRMKMEQTAREQNVPLQTAVSPRYTSTDADDVSGVRSGVPSVLLSLPVRYMHTNVECLDTRVPEDGARLLAHFLRSVSREWEDELWT